MMDGITFGDISFQRLDINYKILFENIAVLKKFANFMSNYCKKDYTFLLETKTVSRSLRRRLSKLSRDVESADHESPEVFLKLAARLDLINISTQNIWASTTMIDWRLKDRNFGKIEEYQFFCDFYDPDGFRMDVHVQEEIIYHHSKPN